MAKFVKLYCKNCDKPFYRTSGCFNEAIKFGWNQFCSAKCHSDFKTKGRILKCENCSKEIFRAPHEISRHNFCSHSCAIIVNNKRYPRKRPEPLFKICQQCGEKYRKSTHNKKFCSRACRTKAEKYSKEELLKIIKNTFKKLKRVPARREILNGVNEACRKEFGSWNKAILIAGFQPNRSHDNRMYKRACAKAKDGHLCDSISEVLIDNWLYKNRISHEKDVRYPNTHHIADWKITSSDKKDVFIEYFGLANDSPRYDRSIKQKEILCKKQNIILIEIYPKDLYPKNYLNKNLKNKFKDYLPT